MGSIASVSGVGGPRDRRIQILVSAAEQRAIADAARTAGLEVGPYLRRLALGDLTPEPGEAEAKQLVQEALARMTDRIEATASRVRDALARIEAAEREGL